MGRLQQTSDEEIIRVARECFKQYGPQVATAEIAKKLNISQATLFSRFGTKKTLLLAALGVQSETGWVHELRGGPTDLPLVDQLQKIATCFLEHYKSIAPNMAMLRSAGISPKEAYAESFDNEIKTTGAHEELISWLQRAHEKGLIVECDFRSVALAILGCFQILPFLKDVCETDVQAAEEPEYIASAIKMILEGIAKT